MSLSEQRRFKAADLIDYATQLLTLKGLETAIANTVARTLVEADLMGHTTHGLRLLPAYLGELDTGGMSSTGKAIVLKDFGGTVTLDGNFLPGPWLVHQAIDLALERIKEHPVVTIVIKKSHHIACLAAYPERATKEGLLMMLTCSDPNTKTVAPFGAITPILGSNPIAAGIPAKTSSVIFDISTSETANGQIQQAEAEGKRLPHPWIITDEGKLSDDPADFSNNPGASVLPLGGIATGYKGTALGIWVEALTNGLSGYGRKQDPGRWCASVFLQIINPAAFAGEDEFRQEAEFLNEAYLSAKPMDKNQVRLPGQRGQRLRDEQMKNGLVISNSLYTYLRTNLDPYNLSFPNGF
ncbi:Ldh family oxidoreductase [Desertivirga brevis]|uniref:Ldh family oxidoreductase n=1 Tax=Desertivirga brevis TaxID=2810310 RepID=UPI001A973260|nr:Ldh family oxidoreductase [Pedobacter sp. SYSU D00873]